MWSSDSWAWIDFETPGIMAVEESWEKGILGIMIGSQKELSYRCIILDKKLEKIVKLYPEYCIDASDLDFSNVLNILEKIDDFNSCRFAFSWSDVDIDFFNHFFGKHLDWDDNGLEENLLGECQVELIDALDDCRRLGRKLYSIRRPHKLKKYMEILGFNFPPGGNASNIIRELKDSWISDNILISYREKEIIHELLQYNYYDCFGLRNVMSKLNQEGGEGKVFPDLSISADPEFIYPSSVPRT